jgi:hypothetical protein
MFAIGPGIELSFQISVLFQPYPSGGGGQHFCKASASGLAIVRVMEIWIYLESLFGSLGGLVLLILVKLLDWKLSCTWPVCIKW